MSIILVTHRPQLARYSDRIYVLENKTISSCGNHNELLKTNPFYSETLEEFAT
jgi:ATP-binding cassette subfamily B protein